MKFYVILADYSKQIPSYTYLHTTDDFDLDNIPESFYINTDLVIEYWGEHVYQHYFVDSKSV